MQLGADGSLRVAQHLGDLPDGVTKIVIPLLPFFIAFTFCSLSYEGSITKQLPVFIQVILIVMAGHYIWMALLYGLI